MRGVLAAITTALIMTGSAGVAPAGAVVPDWQRLPAPDAAARPFPAFGEDADARAAGLLATARDPGRGIAGVMEAFRQTGFSVVDSNAGGKVAVAPLGESQGLAIE